MRFAESEEKNNSKTCHFFGFYISVVIKFNMIHQHILNLIYFLHI